LDLCIVSNEADVELNTVLDIRNDYEYSVLPIKVDVLLYNNCSESFRKIIDNNKVNFIY
jgi:hypothetical protein